MSSKTKQRNRSVLLRLLIVVFCAYLLISFGTLVTTFMEARSNLAEKQTEIEETTLRIEEGLNRLENSTNEEIIEKAARERLGYVYPNEQVFVDISGN